MNHLACIAALCLLAGLVQADTFELSDPANEMYEEQKAQKEPLEPSKPHQMQLPVWNALCSIDTATGSCSCIDKNLARKLSMSQEECVDQVLKALGKN